MSALPRPAEHRAEEKSTERFDLRATPSEAALVRQAAYARHQSVTEFMLSASVEAARKVLAEHHTITVPGEVYQRLQEELASPGAPIDALVNLLNQPRRLQLPNE